MFLGKGYYFWESNEELAHIWGRKRCKGQYYIGTYLLNFVESELFDFTNNPKHGKEYLEYVDFIARQYREKNWKFPKEPPVSLVFEIVLRFKGKNQMTFPYLASRAISSKRQAKFSSEHPQFTLVSLEIIICVYSLDRRNKITKTAFEGPMTNREPEQLAY